MSRSKKIFSLLLSAIFIFTTLHIIPIELVKADLVKKPLMVSAYYSPLPNQRFYMRGSYEADKILNGRGTNGADGTPVYVGMLAAPKTYPFGTKIKIPGLGVGEVHDRGGAIIARRHYDRIDVWMGKGEEGLARALNWGMRLVEGELDFDRSHLQSGLNFEWVSATLPSSTLNRLMAKTSLKVSKPVQSSTSPKMITELQESLRLFGYYHSDLNGEYNEETKKAVLTFQMNEGIISSKDELGAGHFGPKTSARLNELVKNFNSNVSQEKERLTNNLKNLTSGIGKGSTGGKVNQLQNMLWELGYYYGPFTGQYDVTTIDAVFRFQKDYGVIKADVDPGAGYFGPKTHSTLVAAVNKKVKKIAQGPKEMQSWVPAEVKLPLIRELSVSSTIKKRPKLVFDLSVSKTELFTKNININSTGSEVIKLQNKLIDLGFLEPGLNTGYYGEKTKLAVVKFQLSKGVVESVSSQGAGRVGPGTIAALNRL